jgi:serine/threonine protein kinase
VFYTFADFLSTSPDRTMHGYRFVREIGKGAMSHVYLAVNQATDAQVAVKVYNNQQICRRTLGGDEPPYEAVQREVSIMSEVQHRYALSLLDLIQDDETNSTILVFPFAEYGNLQALVDANKMSQPALAVCFLQIAEALRYLHSENIVHRDFKPENILCFNFEYFVLSDFSVSLRLESPNELIDDTKGSPAFLSPEACSGNAYDPKAADVWAFGVSLYRCIFRRFPFSLDSARGRALVATMVMVSELIESEPLVFPELPECTDQAVVPLIEATLSRDVKTRPTFEQVVRFEYFRDAWAVDERQRAVEEEMRRRAEEEEAAG